MLLSLTDVAQHTGLSVRALRRAIERGELPATKLCSRVRVRQEDMETWVAARTMRPCPRYYGAREDLSYRGLHGSLKALDA